MDNETEQLIEVTVRTTHEHKIYKRLEPGETLDTLNPALIACYAIGEDIDAGTNEFESLYGCDNGNIIDADGSAKLVNSSDVKTAVSLSGEFLEVTPEEWTDLKEGWYEDCPGWLDPLLTEAQ